MALYTGTVNSATPATALYNLLATAMTAAGWQYIGQKTALLMGTTAIVEVWATPATTVASNVYTGTIVFFEVDDANLRIRVRCSEKFDNAAAGAPALNVSNPCPGNTSNLAQIPNVDYTFPGAGNGTYVALFQAAGGSAKVGWVNIPVLLSTNFTYWLGARADMVLLANNVSASSHWALAGKQTNTFAESGNGTAVFLAGKHEATDNDCNWVYGAASSGGNTRVSREPQTTASTTGAFCFQIGFAWPTAGTGVGDIGGTPSVNHHWITKQVASPAVLHGVANSFRWVGVRTHLSVLAGFIVASIALGAAPTIGDTITVAGVVYTSLGLSSTEAGTTDGITRTVLAVDGTIF